MVFGGRSEIGVELATRLAPGATVVLAARGADRLDEQVAAVPVAGAAAAHREFDADELSSTARWSTKVVGEFGPLRIAVLAFRILGDQAARRGRRRPPSPSCTPTTWRRSAC